MHASSTAVLALGMFGFATADFYIYAQTSYGLQDGGGAATRADGFKFYNGPPSCDDVNSSIYQHAVDDASYSGVRCKGCVNAGGSANPKASRAPTLLEWNNEMGHFTWYADRNGDFVDVDNVVRGNCVVDQADTYNCPAPFASYGLSQLRCTSDLNADVVNEGAGW